MQGYEKTTGKTVSGCCVLPLSRMRGSLSGDRRNEPGGERDSVLWKKAERLVPGEADSVRDVMDITYQITGGYNDNAVRVSWKMKPYGRHPEWIYLKTFTGIFKICNGRKTFANGICPGGYRCFCYCDEDPCLECVFRCKRGFIIYVYDRQTGLVAVPLDKMNAQWQSGANKM